MKIRLFVNDYLDIHIKEDGRVYVEMGKVNKEGVSISETLYANSSFVTFMKYVGCDVKDLGQEISDYITDNALYLRIRRKNSSSVIFGLHDVETKEELVAYDSFESLVNTEVLQMHNIND